MVWNGSGAPQSGQARASVRGSSTGSRPGFRQKAASVAPRQSAIRASALPGTWRNIHCTI
ncbi:MAG: hypothetical protein QM757_24260 [Paludibaculum sp.]